MMKRWLRDLAFILGLAGLWAVGGYLIGSGLVAFGLDSYPLGIIVASVNIIIGMLWLIAAGFTVESVGQHVQ